PTQELTEWSVDDASIVAEAASIRSAAVDDRRGRILHTRSVRQMAAESSMRLLNRGERLRREAGKAQIVDVGTGVFDRQGRAGGVGQQIALGTHLATVSWTG